MTRVIVKNITHPAELSLQAELCGTFFSRFRGLMLRDPIDKDAGIILDENTDSIMNAAIHMLFMKFDIAVIWVNSQMKVVDATYAKKWQLAYAPSSPARFILETHPDRLRDFQLGDKVDFLAL